MRATPKHKKNPKTKYIYLVSINLNDIKVSFDSEYNNTSYGDRDHYEKQTNIL